MKKFLKVFSLLLVVALTFGLFGCGKEDPTEETTQLTQAQILTMFSSMVDVDNPNFTATMNANYTVSMQPTGEPVQSQSDALSGIIIKMNGTDVYTMVPNDCETYTIGNYSIYKDLDVETPGYEIEYYAENENTFSNAAIATYVNNILQETFSNMTSFDPSWVSTQALTTGAYSMSIGTNLKEEVTSTAQAIVTYKDQPLATLINNILTIRYGNTLTVQSLAADLKTSITATSTVSDVVAFVGTKLGIDLSDTFTSIATLAEEEEILTANIYSMLDITTSTEFDAVVDGFVSEYLTNTELTLDGFMQSIPTDESDELAMLVQIYNSLSGLQVADLSFNVTLTSDTQHQNLSAVNATFSADVTVMGVHYTVSAVASLALSNINSTTVTIPTMTNIDDVYIRLHFETTDLTANTEKVITNMNFGETNFVLTNYSVLTQTATYNATAKTITLSADAVNQLINNNYLYGNSELEDFYLYATVGNYED